MDPTICKDSRVLIVLAFEQGSLAVRLKEKIMFADRATIIIKSANPNMLLDEIKTDIFRNS